MTTKAKLIAAVLIASTVLAICFHTHLGVNASVRIENFNIQGKNFLVNLEVKNTGLWEHEFLVECTLQCNDGSVITFPYRTLTLPRSDYIATGFRAENIDIGKLQSAKVTVWRGENKSKELEGRSDFDEKNIKGGFKDHVEWFK